VLLVNYKEFETIIYIYIYILKKATELLFCLLNKFDCRVKYFIIAFKKICSLNTEFYANLDLNPTFGNWFTLLETDDHIYAIFQYV
jgi:hypothetical protein